MILNLAQECCYLENKVGVVDFTKACGLVEFQSPRARQGPRALKFYHSAGFCKIYYSHFIFEVMTFLRKIQNWYFYTKNCQIVVRFHKLKGKTTTSKFNILNLEGKTTTPKFNILNLEGKTTTPKFNILNLEGKTTTSKFKIQIA